MLTDCTANSNAGEGFNTGTGSALRNCSAGHNGNDGFRAGIGNIVQHCAAYQNGRDPDITAADGFELVSYARVSHCTSAGNGGAGMRAASPTSFYHYIESNTVGGGISLTNATNVVIWNKVDSITPAPSYWIGPLNDARTTKPFSNF